MSGTDTPPAQQQAFIKLRGLPFASTPDKVLEFLGPDVDVLNRAEVGTGQYHRVEAQLANDGFPKPPALLPALEACTVGNDYNERAAHSPCLQRPQVNGMTHRGALDRA